MTTNKERILLIGGTSDAVEVAQELLLQGHWVLHSRFTDAVPLRMPTSEQLAERFGALDSQGFLDLIRQHRIDRIVDAAHPFAVSVHHTVQSVADIARIPYLRIHRPHVAMEAYDHVLHVTNHYEAAEVCASYGGTVLATIGSRNIGIYRKRLQNLGQDLFARVLDDPQSIQACLVCGISLDHIIQERGPFSIEQNLKHIQQTHASILVTKDSGERGGLLEKLRAAQQADCLVVMVDRPATRNQI